MIRDLLTWAVVCGLLAWALLAWGTVAGRRGRAGVAVTVGTLGAWAASSSMALALAACYAVGVAR